MDTTSRSRLVVSGPSVIGGVWLWKDSFGWLWTDKQKFPFLFSENSQSWLYYYGVLNQRRLLFDYGTGQWIVLDESKVMERGCSMKTGRVLGNLMKILLFTPFFFACLGLFAQQREKGVCYLQR